ncbi:hypothetical protein [Aurantiacibacter sediminis]|uniref:Uncharacterized protein n=1 Tax=Aurantiacibacter sediminis TaxID=2793064 RepID=A0ABS0N447_9SPHN|nr:hypothetical protein [Aurantiacibacter sediminis]MBH5322733.1 hypothetical protein [Aurantiacibacter sediminis]
MSSRDQLFLTVMALMLGARFSDWMGPALFNSLIIVGFAFVLVWAIIDYRNGEKVFIWQSKENSQ